MYSGICQISPGKLTVSHSKLEGTSNCTSCHEIGNKISEQKCLNCHTALQTQISNNRGYHVSNTIKTKSCITCHSEHHGVNFEMIRFDKKSFNHNLTGYKLSGAHKLVDCASCHSPEHISDPKIRLNPNTYLGLDTKCASCHEDVHVGSLSKDCKKCHNQDKFVPTDGFNHANTSFPLKDSHAKLDCKSCHSVEFKAGKKFQNFANVAHSNCTSCHSDPHKGDFGTNCKSCHNESSFQNISASNSFNHNVTGFALEGKHRTIDCRKCHDNRAGTSGSFQEFKSSQTVTCKTCHDDVHDNKFGEDCKSCHSTNGFSGIKNLLASFDHDLTGYELEGKHLSVDCKKCHTSESMISPIEHTLCKNCHNDYHNGELGNSKHNDCGSCHNNEGFGVSTYNIEQHQASNFKLNGSHLATACISCHFQDNKWSFRNIGNKCNDCHDNIHEGYLDSKFIPNNDCAVCHNNDAWSDVTFNHSITKFQLLGKHLKNDCRSCHFEPSSNNNYIQKFALLPMECVTCHSNVHGSQFNISGTTDCVRCHGFEKWDRSNFNHDNTSFKLVGAHLTVDCNQCHKPDLINDQKIVLYKTGKLECIDCHL